LFLMLGSTLTAVFPPQHGLENSPFLAFWHSCRNYNFQDTPDISKLSKDTNGRISDNLEASASSGL
jgi:hypothetical protein